MIVTDSGAAELPGSLDFTEHVEEFVLNVLMLTDRFTALNPGSGIGQGFIEKDLSLIQISRSHFVERFPLGNAGTIEGENEHAAAGVTHLRIDLAHQQNGFGDGAVRDPGRFLPRYDILVSIPPGDTLGFNGGITEGGITDDERVRTMIRFGDRPASDYTALLRYGEK
jgi:hypothetical protein